MHIFWADPGSFYVSIWNIAILFQQFSLCKYHAQTLQQFFWTINNKPQTHHTGQVAKNMHWKKSHQKSNKNKTSSSCYSIFTLPRFTDPEMDEKPGNLPAVVALHFTQ